MMFQDLMEMISATGQCLFTSYAFFPDIPWLIIVGIYCMIGSNWLRKIGEKKNPAQS